MGNRHVRTLSPSTISRIVSEKDDDTSVALAVEAFANEVKNLAEQDRPPQVVICALPVEVIERVSNMRSTPADDEAEDDVGDDADAEDAPVVDRQIENFRGALKAATLAVRIPIQIVWPTTYDNDAVVKRSSPNSRSGRSRMRRRALGTFSAPCTTRPAACRGA